ncbi:MAG: glycoside hydrolase family 3 N-terminal domain-containing protein [Alkalispirochaeta sp.]
MRSSSMPFGPAPPVPARHDPSTPPAAPTDPPTLRRRIVLALFVFIVFIVFSGCVGIDETVRETGEAPSRMERDLTAIAGMGPRERLAHMTLREKIGQRFIIYVPRSFAAGEEARRYATVLKEGAPAGMIIYPWNYTSRTDLVELTAKLQRMNAGNVPGGRLLIAADQEGGRVAAYRFLDLPRFPSAARIAEQAVRPPAAAKRPGEGPFTGAADPEYVRSVAYITGRDLASLGISMNYAPVLDLTDRPDRSIIGDRSWGNDPDLVATLGVGYVEGMTAAGVIPTVKHFPGHGVTRVDSHGRLPVVEMTRAELAASHLLPFVDAVEAGVPAIMTAHILFPAIDPDFPVTISDVFLREILRDELGFEGVVVSDGLSMGALADNYDTDLVLERALTLDVDLILLHDRYDYLAIIDRVERLIADGRVSVSDVERGALRVLRLKERFGLLRHAGYDDEHPDRYGH